MAFNAGQITVYRYGKGATERLGDSHKGVRRNHDFGSGGYQAGFHLALGQDDFPFLHAQKASFYVTVKLSPQPHSAVALGLRKRNRELTPR